MRLDTRITAKAALENEQLWRDIEAGKKGLIWRIGHQRHSVKSLYVSIGGDLMAEFDDGECRQIKPQAKLMVVYQFHPDYRDMALQILWILPQSVRMDERPNEHAFYYFRVMGYLEKNELTYGAEVPIAAFERCPIDKLATQVRIALGIENQSPKLEVHFK